VELQDAQRVPGVVEVDAAMLAETRALNLQVEELLSRLKSVHLVPAEVTRRVRREGGGAFPPPVFLPQARDIDIPTRAGSIRARVLAPETTPTGVYLHIHGGGWTLGGHDMQDPPLWSLVTATGMVALSIDYRLAPEHPFPAGPDDCEDAALWLLDRGATTLGAPPRFTIGGESAGAHLAALTLLRLRDRHSIRGVFAAANLVFGCFDLGMTPSQRLWDRNLILSPPVMRWFSDNFLPGTDMEQRRDPSISPLYCDLRDMPPALFTVGTSDPLLDDSLFMEARWRMAGGHTVLHVWPEAMHGFVAFPHAMGTAAVAEMTSFLRSV
jgi:acetyl esterase/lipase